MTLEQSRIEAARARPPEKQQDLLEHANRLRKVSPKKPRKSGRGLWADLDISLSAERHRRSPERDVEELSAGSLEDPHRGRLVKSTDISLGLSCPNDPLQAGSF
jgi:hypothetical protein